MPIQPAGKCRKKPRLNLSLEKTDRIRPDGFFMAGTFSRYAAQRQAKSVMKLCLLKGAIR